MVHQETNYGDRDGDKDVDINDKGGPSACPGTVAGACRIMDFDFDGDYDADDRGSYWSALKKFYMRHPGRLASQVGQPFGHQGLLYDPEISTYQNRARQYSPSLRRFLQRDTEGYIDGPNVYGYLRSNPWGFVDPSGRASDKAPVAIAAQLAAAWGRLKAAIAARNWAAARAAAREIAGLVGITNPEAETALLNSLDKQINNEIAAAAAEAAAAAAAEAAREAAREAAEEAAEEAAKEGPKGTREFNPDGSRKTPEDQSEQLDRAKERRDWWEKQQGEDGGSMDRKPSVPPIDSKGKSNQGANDFWEQLRRKLNEDKRLDLKPRDCP